MSVYDNFNSKLKGVVVKNYYNEFTGSDGKEVKYSEVILLVDGDLVCARSTVESVKEWRVDQIVEFDAALAGRVNVRLPRIKIVGVGEHVS